MPAEAHSSISRSPAELPAAKIGAGPICDWMWATFGAALVGVTEPLHGARQLGAIVGVTSEVVADEGADDQLGPHPVQILADLAHELRAPAGDDADRELGRPQRR